MFRTKYHYDNSYYSISGDSIVNDFILASDKKHVVLSGFRDLVAEVQSFADSTDFNVIKKQLSCGNQTITDAFNKGLFASPASSYGDATIGCSFSSDFNKVSRDIYHLYNSLPEEIRSNFDTIDDFINASPDKIQDIIDKSRVVSSEQSDTNIDSIESEV